MGHTLADQLRELGQRGILITAAKQGLITELRCTTPECLCPHGPEHFERKSHPPSDWAPSVDHYPVLRKDGGQLVLGNVRLAHILCNRVDYAKNHGKKHAKDRVRAKEHRDGSKRGPDGGRQQ